MDNTNISNCYVKNLTINNKDAINTATGGIVGRDGTIGTIQNCYVEGKINSDLPNTGGIIGKANATVIENCYAKVDIISNNKFVGGIIGTYDNAIANYNYNVRNNLSIGNIYTSEDENSIDRITGNKRLFETENYAYENQLINGYISKEELGATLLTKKEVLNLDLGTSYKYEEDINKGILPKLYNTEGTELLKNQTDIFLDEEVDLNIEQVEAEKPNTTEVEVTILINNPKEVEITEVEIEDMSTKITRNVTQEGKTSITLKATPNRYYDSYKITKIKYKTGEETKEEIVEAKLDIQFYKEIYSYEDWQTIEEGTYQNYRLMADIDFSGRSDMKYNITVNRLEAENHTYTLKNIDLELKSSSTGLIKEVRNSIKNIKFENVNLTNTANSGNYFGVIAVNNGNVENLAFSNVTVEASKLSYVGIIGNHYIGNITNIELDTINIKGTTYIGFIGCVNNTGSDVAVTQIYGNNLTVEGTGNCVGAIGGYLYSGRMKLNDITIENSNITGNDNTGGITGHLICYNITNVKTRNNNVTGKSNVGGVTGKFQVNDVLEKVVVDSCNIKGNGYQIGGVAGYVTSNHHLYYVNVFNSHIEGISVNSSNVGGISGSAGIVNYFQIIDTKVQSKGSYVGGVIGNNGNSINTGYVSGVTVEGSKDVGGLQGRSNWMPIRNVYVNAQVKATSSTAGGIIGYMVNENTTAIINVVKIFKSMVLDTTVEAPINAGGLVGGMDKELYRDSDLIYDNYVDVDIISDDNNKSSMLIGEMREENPYVKNTYVYKYSTINGKYVYETDDIIEENQYLERKDLEKKETYTGNIKLETTSFSYDSLTEGKYPKIADSSLYNPELQEGVELPEDPEITNGISLMNEESVESKEESLASDNNEEQNPETQDLETQNIEQKEELPEIVAYPISVTEINVDLSSIPENTYLIYSVNGEEKGRKLIDRRTYTFEYNFQDILEIKLEKAEGTENKIEKIKEITAEEMKNKISIENETYGYLEGEKLNINEEEQEGEYVNVYDGKALNKEGKILNIVNKEKEKKDIETKILGETKSRKSYEYEGNEIKVYGTYSTINGNVKAHIYTVKNGRLSGISNKVEMKIGEEIVDSYNEKDYQTILGTDGKLYDLKEKLNYPEKFENKEIDQIEVDSKNPMVIVYYTSGQVIVFNYVTGEEIYNNNVKKDITLIEYIKESFTKPEMLYEDTKEEYEKGKELMEKLEETPVDVAITIKTEENNTSNNSVENKQEVISSNVSSKNKYIEIYNPENKAYDIYQEEELISSEKEEPETENVKIKANNLEGFYNTNFAETEKSENVNGLLIVLLSIATILIVLIILRKNIKKSTNKNNIK